MAYKSLRACANDLERNNMLLRIKTPLDPNLEMAEVHRRIYDAKGPAILFENVMGSPFQAISNIYSTEERLRYMFRHTFEAAQRLFELKVDPTRFLQHPQRYLSAPKTALSALPLKKIGKSPITWGKTTIDQLPQIISWPMDGGAFVTLPQVFTQPPGVTKAMDSNIGMYRIQLSGNDYVSNKEIGMHYQIHRGIGIHHRQYLDSDEPFKASIFVGGPPSHAFSAIMPMPEGLSELTFAGILAGRRFRYTRQNGHFLSSDADFVITGTIRTDKNKPEGPFGDHIGYYSLQHDFPVMEVESVYHRKDPLWHFTVVGRPPQEDSGFGWLIHKLVKELGAQEFPGVKQIHAVDEAGVHPLLLAIGSERYMPFRNEQVPEEILTQAMRILGSGQTSLAKYLWIADGLDVPQLQTHHYEEFFRHMLERVDWRRDLHFITNTTIDTLDYSGQDWNAGSKLIVAAAGPARRKLTTYLQKGLSLPDGFGAPKWVLPGILAIQAPTHNHDTIEREMKELTDHLKGWAMDELPLIILTEDSQFLSANMANFMWVTFTRSNPSHDIYGVGSKSINKHWGCTGPLIIDARKKSHHAPELIPDAAVSRKVDRLFSKGGELYDYK